MRILNALYGAAAHCFPRFSFPAHKGKLERFAHKSPFCAARCLPSRRRSGRANDFYSFSSGQTACRKSCAFAPGCRRTGLSARSPHTAALGGRFALHASVLALRGIAGLFQMKKGRLRAKSRAFSGVVRKGGFVPLRYAPAGAVTTPFLRHSPRGLHFAAQRCMALPPPAFPRTLLLLLCLFRQSDAVPEARRDCFGLCRWRCGRATPRRFLRAV